MLRAHAHAQRANAEAPRFGCCLCRRQQVQGQRLRLGKLGCQHHVLGGSFGQRSHNQDMRYAVVKEQAEQEGLDKIFVKSGFEWREPGCSMCLAMNADKLKPEERCASTSNRNFEGRQGRGGRTHLVSPGMAIAAAVTGRLTDVRKI